MIKIDSLMGSLSCTKELILKCSEDKNSYVILLKSHGELSEVSSLFNRHRIFNTTKYLCGLQITTMFITKKMFMELSGQELMMLLCRLRKPSYKGEFACYVINSLDLI